MIGLLTSVIFLSLFLFPMFFFFKQKTAYEIRLSLVGSEMCIRDRSVLLSPVIRSNMRALREHTRNAKTNTGDKVR